MTLLHSNDEHKDGSNPVTVSGTACCPVDSGTNLWVNFGYPAAQLAQWLMGTNPVTVQNASYSGAAAAIGIFGNGDGVGLGGHTFPFDTGVILSSGRIGKALGPNNESGSIDDASSNLGQPGDAELNDFVDVHGTVDAAVLEFDMVATNSFMLRFQYVYASEEYPEYIASPPAGYNDPMAIFVTTNRVGTNWIITTNDNIALVPGTTNVPVSVNTINGGLKEVLGHVPSFSPTNWQYYVDNNDPDILYTAATNAAPSAVYNLQYDGFTTNLVVQFSVIAGITNRIKIAIADYAGTRDSDYFLDSAVFLKAQVIPCP